MDGGNDVGGGDVNKESGNEAEQDGQKLAELIA